MAIIVIDESRAAESGMSAAPRDEHAAAQESEVSGRVAGAGAGLVLEPGGVAGVMIFVLDAPAEAGRAQRVVRGQRLGQNEHPTPGGSRAGGFVYAVALDFEQLGGVGEAEFFRGDGEDPEVALVDAAVADFAGSRKKGGASWASTLRTVADDTFKPAFWASTVDATGSPVSI